MGDAGHRLAGDVLGNAGDLEEDGAGLDAGRPEGGLGLALAHPLLERLLGDGLVGEDPDEDLALTTEEVLRRDAARVDLAGAEPVVLERLQAELAEGDVVAPRRVAAQASALLLAELDSLGH